MPRPPRPWFRFYSEQLENRKAQSLRREEPVVYGVWVSLLCIANAQKVRGSLPLLEDIVFALRPDPDEMVRKAVEVLIERRFVDQKGSQLRMHNWKGWQYPSDAYKSTGRQNRHEEGTRNSGGRNAVGTRNSGGRNAVGTLRERVDKELEKEGDTEREDAPANAGPLPFEPDEKPKRERRTVLTEADIQGFVPLYAQLNVNREAEKFHDHIKAKSVKYIDQVAAFRNWLRRAEDYGRDSRVQSARHTVGTYEDAGDRFAARLGR
jgi:hypothetical protein